MASGSENTTNSSPGRLTLPDKEKCLVERFKEGDVDAFEEIYESYSGTIFKYGQSLTTDLELLEDALQDLFISFWNKRFQIDIRYSVSFYLIKSFRRLVLKRVKESKGKQILLQEYFQILENGEDTFQTDELPRMEVVKEAIKSLPAKQYEIIMLKYIYGYSNDHIAEIMDITVESTYNLAARALAHLKQKV